MLRKKSNFYVRVGALLLLAATTGEITARYVLGLGTPPISVPHPRIEYMFKPNQNVNRFGNRFIVNQYGMRTEPFSAKKEKEEFRIMAFGDSVLNGGNLTDQAHLATSLVRESLTSFEYENVVVGNISAGSWGPGNWLAYAKEYGFFGADIVALVISSHDYADNPKFLPLDRNTHPTEAPISALLEGIERYLPRYFPYAGARNTATEADRFAADGDDREMRKGLEDLSSFLALAKDKAKMVLVFQHFEKSEIENGIPHSGYYHIKAVCEQLGIAPISLEPYFRRSIEDGADPYRDNIHPNQIGQSLIADAIMEALLSK
jgi:hypothetical protein